MLNCKSMWITVIKTIICFLCGIKGAGNLSTAQGPTWWRQMKAWWYKWFWIYYVVFGRIYDGSSNRLHCSIISLLKSFIVIRFYHFFFQINDSSQTINDSSLAPQYTFFGNPVSPNIAKYGWARRQVWIFVVLSGPPNGTDERTKQKKT